MKLKEHFFKNDTFIGGWYIPEDLCDVIIKYHDDNLKKDGVITGNIVDKKIKESKDVEIPKNSILLETLEPYLKVIIDLYKKKYTYCNLSNLFLREEILIQKYLPNQGFKIWHNERPSLSNTKRTLVFMIYLNDVADGGTEFFYQKLITPAKKGLTLIWPAEWTHTHKGQISKKHIKYIVTSWFSF